MTRTSALASTLGVVALLAILPSAAAAQTDTRTTCPGTFQVLHDDAIGKLKLRAGAYTITVLNPARLSCARASRYFAQFLQDFDGKLGTPWVVNASTSTFTRGAGSPIGFAVARSGGTNGGGGKNNPTSNTCPSFFRVVHNDHIGKLVLKAGNYRINLINSKTLTCAKASRYFAQFLQDYDGKLGRPWIISSLSTATFRRGKNSNIGFRVKLASGKPKKPSGGGKSQGECPGTFRVVNSTAIGRLKFKAGPYLTFAQKGSGLSCGRVTRLFMQFLDKDFSGRLPSPWTLNATTGTFTNGRKPGFRVKPAK
jgi:hypothetical protein